MTTAKTVDITAKRPVPPQLKPFKKGGDPRINRKGRPPSEGTISKALKGYLTLTPRQLTAKLGAPDAAWTRDDISVAELLALIKVRAAARENHITEELMDRIEGKPKQSMDVTSNGETIDAVAAVREIQERRAAREAAEAAKKP